MATDSVEHDDSIKLALSGGGFRATLFHLGVIRYLRETGRLAKVKHIASVSGGSITATHLILNWGKYTGDEKAFAAVAAKLVQFVRRNVRGRIVAKAILKGSLLLFACHLLPAAAWYWDYLSGLLIAPVTVALAWACWKFRLFPTLASSLMKEYGGLFGGKPLSALRETVGAPKALIATTNLSTGAVLYFSDDGLHVVGRNGDHYQCEHLPVSVAVAASSAFPPAFTPIKISSEYLRIDRSRLGTPQYLTDGGVFDNLGGHVLDTIAEDDSQTIVSSAEPLPDFDLTGTFRLLACRAARATDILMQRVSKLETERRPNAKHIQLMQDLDGSAMAANLQKLVRSIRTDLDGFSALEVQLLYFKGYLAARHTLDPETAINGIRISESGVPLAAGAADRWLPIAADDQGLGKPTETLERSSALSMGGRIRLAFALAGALLLLPFAAYKAAQWMPPRSTPFTAVRYNATPEQLAMKRENPWMEAFLSELRSTNQQCNGTDVTALVQTPPLEEWFWMLRPNGFDCELVCDLPAAKLFYCRAFLIGGDGRLSKVLDVKPGERMRIHVSDPQRKDRLFVIAGVCWPTAIKTDEIRHYLKLELMGSDK